MQVAAHPRTVLQKMREGARKCQGPARCGLVLCFLRRKRSYFILWRTRPPEMLISSHLVTTCKRKGLSVCFAAGWLLGYRGQGWEHSQSDNH